MNNTTLIDAIEGRRTVRRFLPDPVSDADLRTMIRFARLAPNAGNRELWRFIAVKDRQLREELMVAFERGMAAIVARGGGGPKLEALAAQQHAVCAGLSDAPVVVAVLAQGFWSRGDDLLVAAGYSRPETEDRRAHPALQSIGAAIQNLCLAAHAMGYGTWWMTGPLISRDDLEACLHVEEPWHLVALVPLGRPAGTPPPRPRKAVEEILEIR